MSLSRPAAAFAAQSYDRVAQGHIVHVHHAVPAYRKRVNSERVLVPQAGINHGCQQVVGRTYGMDIAGEVEVDVLHRQRLGVSSSAGTSLDAESRPHGGLSHGADGVFPDVPQCLPQAQGHHGLALSQRSGRHCGHQNQFAVRLVAQPVEHRQLHFGHMRAVQTQLVGQNTRLLCYFGDVSQLCLLGDLQIAEHVGPLSYLLHGHIYMYMCMYMHVYFSAGHDNLSAALWSLFHDI